ncbi:MAG: radical SAM protein [Theionarchaea archaeon]|nr:radical SAM protein [Theionarchaea archaeon]
MKESVYNVYLLDEKEKKGLVYNTMHRSIVQIDDEVYTLMRENRIDEIDDEVLEVLKSGKIVVDDDLNELDMLKVMFNRAKYNAVSIGFTIIPTHACNLACKYCYQGHGDVLSNTMNKETMKKTVEFIKKGSVGRRSLGVNFYGGEPLLFPDIVFEMLEELKKYANENNIQFSATFTSNGTLFTEEIVEKLKDYNHEVQITLCGPKEIHDQTRIDKKGNGTYERLMEVIELFKKHGTAFHIRVDVDQDNYDGIRLLLEDLKQRGYEGLYIGFCPIGKDICYTEIERDTKEVDVVSLTRLSKMAHDMGFQTNPIYIHNFVEGCSALSDNFLAVDPMGNVFKCIAAPNYTEHKFGVLNENGDLTDMNYEAYCKWTLRDPLQIEECVECKFAPICGGGCALAAYAKHGDINTPGCEEKELGEIMRTFIMLKYPELFEGCTYESIVL